MPILKPAVVAGSLGLDIIPVFPETASSDAVSLFAQGKFNDLNGTRLYLGGCVGNTGIAMHKLGVPTTLISKVGQDLLGKAIRMILEQQDASVHIEEVADCNSTSTVVIAPFGGDRILLHSRGASQTFVSGDISPELLKDAALLHFGYPTAMKYLYREDGAEFIKLVRQAKKTGVTVSVDTSQPDPNSEAGQVDWRRVLAEALPSIDIFMPSMEELLFMLHRPVYDDFNEKRGSSNMMDVIDFSMIPKLADELLGMGARIVMLKLGKKGLYLRTADESRLRGMGRALPGEVERWSGRELLCPPYFTGAIRSTTGAGDNAIAGFLAALLGDCGPERSLLLASANALRCIESYETTDQVIPLDALNSIVERGPAQEKIAIPGETGWLADSRTGILFGERDSVSSLME